MSNAQKSPQRANISFRFQLQHNSIYYPLAQFINEHSQWAPTKQQKILVPLNAYWSPFALEQLGASEPEIREAALASIYNLRLQINLIAAQFHLSDEPFYQQAAMTAVTAPKVTAPTEAPSADERIHSTESNQGTDSELELDELDFAYDGEETGEGDILNQFS